MFNAFCNITPIVIIIILKYLLNKSAVEMSALFIAESSVFGSLVVDSFLRK